MKVFILSFALISSYSWASFHEHAPVVYGVSPSFVSADGSVKGLEAIRRRLPEIKELGANVVWMQPVTPPAEIDGQGYDVLDYKKIWSQLGTKNDLKKLVADAHRLHISVLLDVVLNHSSHLHPFVLDIKKKGKKSPYYDFYQHQMINQVPYAEHFHSRKIGGENFYYYFWKDLLNFNYQNQALRDYLMDALTYWIKEYDVDGFRFDASWGPSSRYPEFYPMVSSALRKVKADVILLAEDAAGYPQKYSGTSHPHLKGSGFDWAYDWDTSSYSISKWSFQIDDEDHEQSLFTLTDGEAAADHFMQVMNRNKALLEIKPLRFIENNDTPGILRTHDLRDMQWAVKVTFLLPGVPLIYYGQEAGIKRELYDLPRFDPHKKMASFNPQIWKFYHDTIALRLSSPALAKGEMRGLHKTSPTTVSYEMVEGSSRVTVMLDFQNKEVFLDGKLLTFK